MRLFKKPLKDRLPEKLEALPGRKNPILTEGMHEVSQRSIFPPFPENTQQALFAMGCFWGAERLFWRMEGVWVTAVGYAGGFTPHPTYEEVCSGWSAHTETVLVVYQPEIISYSQLLKAFWEQHDPTQGFRQGNDQGTQYRSAIFYFNNDQKTLAEKTQQQVQQQLSAKNKYSMISTEILPAPIFYYAEQEHQQYLAKNPHGYCGLKGTGIQCPL